MRCMYPAQILSVHDTTAWRYDSLTIGVDKLPRIERGNTSPVFPRVRFCSVRIITIAPRVSHRDAPRRTTLSDRTCT